MQTQKPTQEESGPRIEIYMSVRPPRRLSLHDWLRPERELQKVALFTRGWNRFRSSTIPTPRTEMHAAHGSNGKEKTQW